MLLRSTLFNYMKDLPPVERQPYMDALLRLPVQTITVECGDRIKKLMNGSDTLKVMDPTEAIAALREQNITIDLAQIEKRAFMITPVGEMVAFATHQNGLRRS